MIFKTWQEGNSGALSNGSFRGIRSRLASWASEHPLFPLWIATTLYYVGEITSVEKFEFAGSISTAERIQLAEFEKYWSKDFAADSWHLEPSRKFKTWKTLASVNMEFDRRSAFFIVNSWITGRFYTIAMNHKMHIKHAMYFDAIFVVSTQFSSVFKFGQSHGEWSVKLKCLCVASSRSWRACISLCFQSLHDTEFQNSLLLWIQWQWMCNEPVGSFNLFKSTFSIFSDASFCLIVVASPLIRNDCVRKLVSL